MSTNFGGPVQGSPDPDERGGSPANPAPQAGPGDTAPDAGPGAAAGSAGGWYSPYGTGGPGGYGTSGYGSGPYRPGEYGPAGYGPAGYGPAGYGPAGYGPAGYGPGGPGAAGYAAFGGGPDDKRRARRRTVLIAGVSAVAAAALTVAGFGAANAFGSTTLTSAQIAQKVDPGLVDIVTNLGYQQGQAAGTGMVLTSSGEILTNNHVIRGATQIKATDVGNGRSYTARVVGYDEKDDVAVLQLQGASGLQTVSTSSAGVSVGDKVVALGNAEGKGGTPSKATGKVTGLGRTITASDEGSGTSEQLNGMIQTNAPIQPGDSGGALVNRAGQIVGMNTAASTGISMTGFQGQSSQGQTQAFAIPISKAERIAGQIEAGHASSAVHIGQTAFLGVQVSTGSTGFGGFGGNGDGTTSNGALVAGVVSGSAAAQAGLAQGDVITSVAGHAVSSANGISATLASHHPGDKITIGWTGQAGQSHTATVTLTTGPAA